MVRKAQRIPECYEMFDFLHVFECFNDNCIYAYAALDLRYLPVAMLHLEVKKWSPSVFKEFERDWLIAKDIMKNAGANACVLMKPGKLENQYKYTKFIKRFGFNNPVQYTTSYQPL